MTSPSLVGTATAAQVAVKQARFIRKLTALISGGSFIDGFILGGIGIVMPAITTGLSLTTGWQGLIGASALFGTFFGGPLGGYLADRIGRRPMFTIDLLTFLIGSIAQFFVADAWQLFAVRLFMGMAIGADYAIGWPLLAEFAPARVRGKLLCVQEVGWYAGFLASYAAGWALTISHAANWNVILGLSTLPTLVVLLLRIGTPESPRWLMSKGRDVEATELAREYMQVGDLQDLHAPTKGKTGFGRLFSSDYRKTTFFVCVFWVCTVTPYFAIGTFAPLVLEELGVHDGLTGGLVLNVLAWIGTIVAMFLVERVGRRKLSITAMYISFVSLFLVGILAHSQPTLIVICILVFTFANTIPSALTGVYPVEVFPTEIRGTGVGFAAAVSRIGAAGGTFLLPLAIKAYGTSATLLVAAGICLFGAVVTHWLAPETKGKHLSEIASSKDEAGGLSDTLAAAAEDASAAYFVH